MSVPPPLTAAATTAVATCATATSSTADHMGHGALLRASEQGVGIVMATVVQNTSTSKSIPVGAATKSVPSIISASHPLFVEEKSHGERLVVGSSRGEPKLEKAMAASPLRYATADADRSPSVPASESESTGVPAVFVDANYHIMFKEYNLRKSRSLTNSPRPVEKKKLKLDSNNKSTTTAPDKRQRSDDSTDDQAAAKRTKVEEGLVRDVIKIEPQEENEREKDKERSGCSTKSSPIKRKPSLSKSFRSRKKQKAGATKKTESNKASGGGLVLCALCLRRDSESNLGFLYGPYKPQVDEEELRKDESKNHAGGGGGGSDGDENKMSSLWVHEDCAVWAPGVCLVGGKLLGLHDAVADGVKLVCVSCCVSEMRWPVVRGCLSITCQFAFLVDNVSLGMLGCNNDEFCAGLSFL